MRGYFLLLLGFTAENGCVLSKEKKIEGSPSVLLSVVQNREKVLFLVSDTKKSISDRTNTPIEASTVSEINHCSQKNHEDVVVSGEQQKSGNHKSNDEIFQTEQYESN